ncbi:MAG: translation initiation factor IF-2 [Bacillota bacterium]
MTKIRVYELAKELNTSSKRLMEKLAEINIVVKNHMSLLEENELEALYDHIGIIKHNDDRKNDTDERKAVASMQHGGETAKESRKETKNAPRIIRTTEINLDAKSEVKEVKPDNERTLRRGDDRDPRRHKKNDFVRSESSTSGLRPGFIREAKPDYKRVVENDKRNEQPKTHFKESRIETVKAADNKAADNEVRNEILNTSVKEENVQKDMKMVPKQDNNIEEKKEQASIPFAGPRVDTKPLEDNTEKVTNSEALKETVKETAAPRNTFERPQNRVGTTHNNPGNNRVHNNRTHTGQNNNVNRPPMNKGNDFRRNDNRNNDNRSNDFKRNDNRNNDFKGNDSRVNNFKKNDFNRPQGGNFANKPGNRPGVERGRDMNRTASKPLEIPKVELTPTQKEELNSQRGERRDFNKDVDKDVKRELKREVPKGLGADKNKNKKPIKNAFTGKKGVSEVLSEDFILEEFFDDGVKKVRKVNKPKKDARNEEKHIPPKAVLTSIKIPETITVKDLAESLKKTASEVIKKLMGLGILATLNQELDFDTAAIISDEFGVKAEKEVVVNEEDILFDDSDEADEAKLEPRPPVVVVMGHVDHGKTSLLDAIKETNVTESEAGGITQHIGAYMVKVNNRNITFLDTPGHEAFTAMRARGAQVTDVAILVVAADDGVMPQTVEAINHAKAANVTIIVAVNKIDKPGANPDRVKQELTEHGLVVEEWGGDTICVEVSAKQRTNIDHLLEMVLLAADMLELKADPDRQAKGTVIEAKLDKDRGPIATVLVQRGTLNTGDAIVTGTIVGRIRAMVDDKGHRIKKAGPSTPVEILGLPEVPEAGEIFYAITDEKIAKQLAEKRRLKQREQQLKSTARVSLDDLFNQIKEGKVKDLNIIVKADVQGSVEAVKQSLEKLSNEEVRVKIIHGGVGSVTESDVTLAQVSNAIIIGFNVRPAANVVDAAKDAGVDLRLYRIIYNAIEDIQAAMKGMLEPTFKEVVLGHIEIRQTFKVSGIGTIGGGYVTDGKVVRNSEVRLVRDGIVVHEGKLASLKRFKDDAKEVAQGYECGLSLEKFNDLKVGDVIEAFAMEEVER